MCNDTHIFIDVYISNHAHVGILKENSNKNSSSAIDFNKN